VKQNYWWYPRQISTLLLLLTIITLHQDEAGIQADEAGQVPHSRRVRVTVHKRCFFGNINNIDLLPNLYLIWVPINTRNLVCRGGAWANSRLAFNLHRVHEGIQIDCLYWEKIEFWGESGQGRARKDRVLLLSFASCGRQAVIIVLLHWNNCLPFS